MNYTTTLTSKAQITIPKSVREKLNLQEGTKIDLYPTSDGGFIGRPQRKSNILKYEGNLAHLDDGRPLREIREEAHSAAAKEITEKYKTGKLYRIKMK